MKSLQMFATAGAILLSATIAFAAPPFGATPGPTSLLGPPTPTSPEVLSLITEGQAAFQKGEIAEAKRSFEMAYSLDSRNVTVINYLRRIQAAEKSGAFVKVDRQRQLAGVIIPKIQFKDATLASAVDYLKKEIERVSAGKVNVSFVVQIPPELASTQTVTLNLANIPASEAVRYLADLANATVTYDNYAVVIKSKPTAVPPSSAAALPATPAVPGLP